MKRASRGGRQVAKAHAIPEALVLAGGYGKRLKPLTDTVPKPLIEMKEGYCILDKQLDGLRHAGVRSALLLTGHLHEKIERRYGGSWHGMTIRYSVEDRPLGTWGAVKKALGDGPVVIMNGDIVTDVDVGSLMANGTFPVTVLGVPMRSPYGVLETSGTAVVGFKEKPVLPYYINGGIYYAKDARELLAAGRDLREGSIEQDIFPRLAKAGKLGAYIETDPDVLWKSLDSAKDLEETRTMYESRTDKPWGHEVVVALTEKYLQKKLYIKEGHRTSLHYHREKMETLYVVKGKVRLDFEKGSKELAEGERETIPPGLVHSIVALRNTQIDEASSPHPDDTVRVKDFYER